jgi:hypothetical protein
MRGYHEETVEINGSAEKTLSLARSSGICRLAECFQNALLLLFRMLSFCTCLQFAEPEKQNPDSCPWASWLQHNSSFHCALSFRVRKDDPSPKFIRIQTSLKCLSNWKRWRNTFLTVFLTCFFHCFTQIKACRISQDSPTPWNKEVERCGTMWNESNDRLQSQGLSKDSKVKVMEGHWTWKPMKAESGMSDCKLSE